MAPRLLTAVGMAILAVALSCDAVGAAGRVHRQAWTSSSPVNTFSAQPNEVYVAVSAGIEEARSFIHVDITDVAQADLDDATLRLYEAADGLAPENAAVVVCALGADFEGEGKLTG